MLAIVQGNDGGSISKRDEMVRTKASVQKVDASLLRQSLWTVCRLSREPLQAPVVSDALGRLYNKDAVIQHLLQRHQSEPTTDPIPHIRGLRDTTDLNLTTNTLYRPASAGQSEQHSVYPFMCPLSARQMDGMHRFVYIAPCGCVMSASGLQATLTDARGEVHPCPVCAKHFHAALTKGAKAVQGSDVATINPDKDEEDRLREKMESRAQHKKKKARTADQEDGKDTEQEAKKRRKAEKKDETRKRIAQLTAELAAEKA